MTSEDIRGEIERDPFLPIRLHLVSGKNIAITSPNDVHLLQNAVMVFFGRKPGSKIVDGYDVISLRNIERIENFPANGKHKSKKTSKRDKKHD